MIELKNLNKAYNNGKIVLDNINVSFGDTGLYSIIGRSGSGKTTLINIISGLDEKTSGDIIHNYSDGTYSTIVFQDSQLIEGFTAYENIKLIMELHNCYDEELLLETLDKFELKNIKDSKIEKISGGEKQRVAIVRALLSGKPVIICDEPTSALDEENALIVSKVLKEISKERLAIVVTHDKEFFTKISDTIYEIKDCQVNEIRKIDINLSSEYMFVPKSKVCLKNLLGLSFYQFKKNISRIIAYSFFLLLSVFFLTYSLNSLYTSDAKKISMAYSQESVEEVSFQKTFKRNDVIINDSLIDFDWNTLKSDERKTVFKNAYVKANGCEILIDKFILAEKCPTTVLFGNNIINDDEVILPYFFAKQYSENISELLNQEIEFKFNEDNSKKYFKLKVVGISESKQGTNYNYYDKYIVINEKTYNSTYNELSKHFYATYISDAIHQTTIGNVSDQTENCFIGRMPQNDNEIVVGKDAYLVTNELLKQSNSTNYNDLLGLDLNVKFFIPTYNEYNSQKTYNFTSIEFQPRTYVIVGINNTYNYTVTDNEFNNLYELHYDNSRYGITVFNGLSSKETERMNKIGLSDFTYYSEKIDDNIEYMNTINLLLMIISSVFLLIAFYISITYINASKRKKTRIIGILASFGIRKKDMASIIFIDAVCIMFIVSIFNMIASSLLIKPINLFFKNIGFFDYRLVSFSILSVLTILLILMIFTCIYYLLCRKKINKMNIIDLVYEK